MHSTHDSCTVPSCGCSTAVRSYSCTSYHTTHGCYDTRCNLAHPSSCSSTHRPISVNSPSIAHPVSAPLAPPACSGENCPEDIRTDRQEAVQKRHAATASYSRHSGTNRVAPLPRLRICAPELHQSSPPTPFPQAAPLTTSLVASVAMSTPRIELHSQRLPPHRSHDSPSTTSLSRLSVRRSPLMRAEELGFGNVPQLRSQLGWAPSRTRPPR